MADTLTCMCLEVVAGDHHTRDQILQGEEDVRDEATSNTSDAVLASLLSLRDRKEVRATAAEPDRSRSGADEPTPPSGYRAAGSRDEPTAEAPMLSLDELSS